MEAIKEHIESLAKELIDNESLFLVDVVVATGKTNKITVILDGDEGVAIEDCSSLGRKIGHSLEEREEIDEPYILEVTSAGVDSPLLTDRQFIKNIGRDVKVKKADGNIIGKLIGYKDSQIELEYRPGKKSPVTKMSLNRSEIESVVVQISFK